MQAENSLSWVILAGGQASRMGGQDKGLIELESRPLIEHVFSKLSAQTSDISINANRNTEFYQRYAPVFSDLMQNFLGPLAGIHAGLEQATSEWVGFVPCDSPYLVTDYVERFKAHMHSNAEILVAHDGDHQQPVFCMYHKRALPKLTSFLERGERKVRLLYKECAVHFINFDDAPQCFINLNTPEQLRKLHATNGDKL
jgi:molybdopterin-guanine dinucleotide biosynthesis protein A